MSGDGGAEDAGPSLLLVQVRGPENELAMLQERVCFAELAGLDAARWTYLNAVTDPEITWARVAHHDVLLIGGAGAHSVTEEHSFTRPLAEVVRRWVAEGRPMLGSCWGHQFLAWALGGTVETDPAGEEVGTFDIHLTEAGRRDPWLDGLPPTFPVHLGHHDVVRDLPPGLVELAYSERGRNQVVRYRDLPIYGTQFHCEMTMVRMQERLRMYSDEYLDGQDDEASLGSILRPAPVAEGLLRRFLASLPWDTATSPVVG